MAESKDQFLLEIQSMKTKKRSWSLAREYLQTEANQKRAIKIIQKSLKSRRDCYPYVKVHHQIRERICLMNGVLAIVLAGRTGVPQL